MNEKSATRALNHSHVTRALMAVMLCVALLSLPPAVSAQPGQPTVGGECRACAPYPGGASPAKCEPNLDEFNRKKKTALELYEAAGKQIDHSTDDLWEFLKNFGIGSYEATITKGPLTLWLNMFKHQKLKAIEKAVGSLRATRWAAQAGRAGVAVSTLEWAGVLLTLEQLYELQGHLHEAHVELADAQKMVAAANAMYDEAIAALDKALKQSAACEKEREQRMRPAKTLADRAHELMESWQNNGYLYKDPSGEVLDSQAAFKRATDILSGSAGGNGSLKPAIIRAAFVIAAVDETLLTPAQLDVAIAAIDRGTSLFSNEMDYLIRWLGAEESVQTKLKGLIQAFSP